MRILLTGSNGFLGKYIYDYLKYNNEVYTLNKSKNANYVLDLSNTIPIFNKEFDLVIHCAGKAHAIPRNSNEDQLFEKINILGTQNLLEGLSNSGIPPKIVFISSVSVYGLKSGKNILESAPLLAMDPYGLSKIRAENIVKKWCDDYNVTCTILRLPLVVGIEPPGNLGAMIRGIEKGYYFNIAGGNAKKSMVLASDIASYILKAAEIGGTYNLTDGCHPSFKDLSKSISIQMSKSLVPNLPKFIAILLAKIGDIFGEIIPINSDKLKKLTSNLTFDDSKAQNAFGWKPTSVLEGIKIRNDVQ